MKRRRLASVGMTGLGFWLGTARALTIICLLELLMRPAGQSVWRSAVVEQVWKLNCDTMTNGVDVYINYLRRKVDVGFEMPLIRTVRGVGYQIWGGVAGV